MRRLLGMVLQGVVAVAMALVVASGAGWARDLTIEDVLAQGARQLGGAEIRTLFEGSTFDGLRPNHDRVVCRYMVGDDVHCLSYSQKWATKGSTTSGKWLIWSDFLCHEQQTGRTGRAVGERNCRFVLTNADKVFLFWFGKRDHAATGTVKPGTLDRN